MQRGICHTSELPYLMQMKVVLLQQGIQYQDIGTPPHHTDQANKTQETRQYFTQPQSPLTSYISLDISGV